MPLSSFNQKVITCFKDFIKYNLHLAHINLERCGLVEQAIREIAALLRKAQALRCIHLCNNVGLSPETIEWVRARIHAKSDEEQREIRMVPPGKKYEGHSSVPINKKGMMKIFRGASIEL